MNNIPLYSTPDNGSHEDDAEEVPETPIPKQASGSTRYLIRPQGKKASKRKGNASKHDYAKYMEELTRHSELTLAWEMAKFEANKAKDEAKAAAVKKEFQANQREKELLRQERELVREEIMAQRDREIMNTPLEMKSPNSKYFWKSEKEDVVHSMRAREARAR
ncbi:hypothetical protein C1H46_013578 [Malus baccata]|uniref:No apical meristem-associated C-terminal domain-containing protein n=1 Tax=Malus baccata TaxID=106549 RepID=A0A540MRB3_MALBA|nr:hypothetical protein C1H46_013578 [Malus baccata]